VSEPSAPTESGARARATRSPSITPSSFAIRYSPALEGVQRNAPLAGVLLVSLERGAAVELVDDVPLGLGHRHLAGRRLETVADAHAPGPGAEDVRRGSHVRRRPLPVSHQRGLEASLVAGRAADDLVQGLRLRQDLPDQLLADAGEPVGEHDGGGERQALRMCLALRGPEVPAQIGGGPLRVLLQARDGSRLGDGLWRRDQEDRDSPVREAALGHFAGGGAADDLLRSGRGAGRAQRVAQGQVRRGEQEAERRRRSS